MKVLCIGSAYGHVPRRVAALAARGHDVLLLAEHPRPDSSVPVVVPPVFVRSARFGRLRLPRQVAGIVRRHAPDLIHAHSATNVTAAMAAALGGRPLIVSTMGGDIFFDRLALPTSRRLLIRTLLRSADAVTAKSPPMIERLRKLGVAGERVHLVNWGVDTDVFRPRPRAEARARLGLPAERPLVISSRAVDPLYNIHLIVEAFRSVADALPEPHLVVVETGMEPGYARAVRERVGSLDLAARVHWLPEVEFEAMPSLYSAADLLVSFPSQDAVPQTLLEAMACETACLVGDLDTVRAVVTDRDNAWLCANDAASLGKSMLDLLRDRDERARLGRNGREHVLRTASAARSINVVDALYRRLGDSATQAHRGALQRLWMLALWILGPPIDGVAQWRTRRGARAASST